ncbi:hypothetical protein ABZ807_25160 [Micromonospora sp. NPDC047548]|uniref:hypothetical protein n=1 Tax=Micromonospora sp. NPDC047548 TaxID=3155624 RepID=UPI0033F295DA
MTDGTLAASVLTRVAELLADLPAADVAALAEGRARLAVLPVAPPVTAAGPPAPHPAADLDGAVTALAAMTSRADGTAYLTPWPAKDLRALAARLGLRGVAGLRKAELVDRLVDRTVGFRLNSAAVRQL